MAQHELVMPKMGESVAEATIIKWVKNEGDKIKIDETILEIATDKVDSEIPSSFEGVLIKKLFKEGDVVQVGTVIAHISSDVNATAGSNHPIANGEQPVLAKAAATNNQATSVKEGAHTAQDFSQSDRFYSPLVKNIAKEEGISIQELEKISGSGKDGRVTKTDILSYIPNRGSQQAVVEERIEKPVAKPGSNGHVQQGAAVVHKPAVSLMAGDEIIEMDRMRKLIAGHMVMSKHVSPHVTSFVEADVTNMVLWRDKIKAAFEKREGEKMTFTPLFVEAVAKAIKDYPMINVSVDGETIIKRKSINIGMAAALPSGNLIVPVIRNADEKNLVGLTKAVNDLANRARANKLAPDDIQGGTFTLTNVGGFGNVMGTPIINQPQVAIMATGTIKKKPAVIETPQGDMIAIRHMMFLSLSYDHRVVDGSLGGSFLRRVADYLENFDLNRPF
jgi:2-oxoglutarate dehydrogenase E2 component (dihydrolipoamide succinyltransferase)